MERGRWWVVKLLLDIDSQLEIAIKLLLDIQSTAVSKR